MKNNTYYTSLNTLHYNTLLSNQTFKIDSTNNLRMMELTPLRNNNETIPLHLMNANPLIKKNLDTHLLLLTLASALTSAIFFMTAFYTTHVGINAFSAIFLLTSLSALFYAYKHRVISYTYQFANNNTPLFTLRERFSQQGQVTQFVNALNKCIVSVKAKTDLDTVSYFEKNNTSDSKSSECSKHLDFLYNYGFVNDAHYQRINRKIQHKFFGKDDALKVPTENIIYFPVKA